MRYAYLQSEAFAGQRYVGITSDRRKRLADESGNFNDRFGDPSEVSRSRRR